MDFFGLFSLFTGLPFLIFILVIFIRQVKQYERGVMFTMGRFSGVKLPGWRLVVPVFQSMSKVDMRVKAVDVPSQEAITKDNVSAQVNAVIYYKVKDAEKAIIEVEDFYYAVSQLAQTTMRNVVGETTLDQLLGQRESISQKIEEIVDKASDPWGIDVQSVELKDVILPENMKRTMAKEAEAEREKRAVIINAEGELAAAENITKAATMLGEAPGALHLRTLQSINDLSSDQSNTTIWMLPVEALRALESVVGLGKKRS
jgi:regulator of protease activity HflC (stomatin/prohibitin superfamily)